MYVSFLVNLLLVSMATSERLLVILLDGFRWDYVDKLNLGSFKRIIKEGTHAKYMKNDFPTLSYPNYYTIMTGLHTESHGMTGNYMYDMSRDEYFLIGTNPEQSNPHWWGGGEPLWVTANRQGMSSYMFYWLGCEVEIRGVRPEFCQPYTGVPTMPDFRSALTTSFNLLTNGTTNLTAVYSEQPDAVGHHYGPDSDQLAATLRQVDAEISALLDRLDALEDDHKFNVIIVSDHGMTSVSESRVINITSVLTRDLFVTVMEQGAVASVYINQTSKIDQVYNLLKDFHPHMKAYKQRNIPDRYFYKGGKYVGQVTCMADLGWTILQPVSPDFPLKKGTPMAGTHGYDNKERDMRGIFYALGPRFPKGRSVEFLHAVDPYSVMCKVLGITAAPNNGSLERVNSLFQTSTGSDTIAYHHYFLVAPTILLSFLVLFWK
ncbi:glycerophosphocholine cholinephosphodiesterase ENPP6 [Aplysia californica]|uniref:glycerophosphocholine cholinephosphodiesterase n=1 Tax=Aplysia californica TaxID=6500 RepID=A0ABM0KA82_APLCA|nr:glycerophosphocholine cholinephosphodiesterase ENPP6 [Aplysia californica]